MPRNTVGKSGDRWQYRAVLPDGTSKYFKSRKGETLKDFKDRIDDFESSISTNVHELYFGELFMTWFDAWSPTVGASSRDVTMGLYRNHVEPVFATCEVTDISPLMVHNFLESKGKEGLAASTLSKIRSCIDRPYRFAAVQLNAHGLVNPAAVVTVRGMSQKKPQRHRVISEADLQRFFLAAESSSYYNYFRLLNATGFRPSEGAGLKVKDISQDGVTLSRGITVRGLSTLKNQNARRTFPMTEELQEIIEDQKGRLGAYSPDSWLFPAQGGNPSMNALNRALNRICARTAVYERGGRNGLKKIRLIEEPVNISLYDFRHTFATRSARILPAKTLQYLMGHADISITLKYYIGLEDEDIQTAVDTLNKNNLDKI